MAFVFDNRNPHNKRVGDCSVRAISIALDKSWDCVYLLLAIYGFMLCDMPSSNDVWSQLLNDLGYERDIVSSSCPFCTVAEFANEHKTGVYILGTGTHVVCVKDGDYHDAWDSGDETPIFFWRRK